MLNKTAIAVWEPECATRYSFVTLHAQQSHIHEYNKIMYLKMLSYGLLAITLCMCNVIQYFEYYLLVFKVLL